MSLYNIVNMALPLLYLLPLLSLISTSAHAANFLIRNNCPYTVWAAGVLQCTAYGAPPNTLAEYAHNQFSNLDFFDISLVDGFNVPMDFSPVSSGCRGPRACTADINGQCPNVLRAPGGCNNPCTVFKTDQYCCNSGSCSPTDYSRFFKTRCPDAYSYPKDDPTSTFTCPGGTNYRVVFCP
uniref:Osmotin isoform n=1 Tax=Piper colubrinum TaxID=254420 RepID=B5M8X0_9MAGN|nr:osmotin isoform precursor [Piper colubrinum]